MRSDARALRRGLRRLNPQSSRRPKIALPPRTRVAPSATAISKSPLIPIDRSCRSTFGRGPEEARPHFAALRLLRDREAARARLFGAAAERRDQHQPPAAG